MREKYILKADVNRAVEMIKNSFNHPDDLGILIKYLRSKNDIKDMESLLKAVVNEVPLDNDKHDELISFVSEYVRLYSAGGVNLATINRGVKIYKKILPDLQKFIDEELKE